MKNLQQLKEKLNGRNPDLYDTGDEVLGLFCSLEAYEVIITVEDFKEFKHALNLTLDTQLINGKIKTLCDVELTYDEMLRGLIEIANPKFVYPSVTAGTDNVKELIDAFLNQIGDKHGSIAETYDYWLKKVNNIYFNIDASCDFVASELRGL